MPDRLRGAWEWLLTRLEERLDDDSVRPFVPAYYAPWLIWAVFATFLFPPVELIESAMGHQVYVLWVWLSIPGALVPILGLTLRHGGSPIAAMTTPLLFQDWMGLVMQATGHAVSCVLMVLLEYSLISGAVEAWAIQGKYAGVTILCSFLLSAYMFGTFWLSLQCLRKIQKGEQLRRPA